MKREGGFTLIELLVVIAIIALLLSSLVPSLQKAKELARNVVCSTNIRTIYTGLDLYAEDNNGWLPCPFYPSPNDPVNDPSTYPFYGDCFNFILAPDHLNIYGWKPAITYSNRDTFFCPTDRDATTRGVGFYGSTGIGSYGMNDTIIHGTDQGVTTYSYTYVQTTGLAERGAQFRMWSILSPSKTYQTGDSVSPCMYRNVTPDATLSPRHNNSANMLFFDGHVEFLNWDDIPMREWTWMASPWFNVR